MALFLFVDAIMQNKPIKVFNHGNLSRDFTYIDDIAEGVLATLLKNSKYNKNYQLYNIGNNKPVQLMDFITEIEKSTNRTAVKKMMPMQDGDVNQTFADVSDLIDNFDNFKDFTNPNFYNIQVFKNLKEVSQDNI